MRPHLLGWHALRVPRTEQLPSVSRERRRDLNLVAGQVALLAAALAAAVLGTSAADWEPASLLLALLGLALAGQLLALHTGNVQLGPAFVATALAMALLGPAPAAVVALAAMLVPVLRSRTPPGLVFDNTVALTAYAVAGGVAFKALGDPGADADPSHTAGLLHDVGKFTFPDHTLTGTRLTEEDWELIRSHPQRGADIVGRVHGYEEVAEIVLCHHERLDGHGYPRRLQGERIPHLARILAVADCFDVMTARDSYRTPMSFEAAIAELRRVAGTQLDPLYVEIFVGIVMGSGLALEPTERR